ncbi:MAG: DUF2065 domain-containing protein [Kiloniellales bacterium]|nr:DUF2065 domain-containing protein [Kiloniellales bacterium]
MTDFLTALALVLVIEGIVLALIPHRLHQILEMMQTMSPSTLRRIGLLCAAIGVFFVWLIRG